jgi:ubiquinone/menaquinone biosynthesis C-methylase UbiE/superfamily II DNA or RNA helicase
MTLKFESLVEIINAEIREATEDDPSLIFPLSQIVGEFKRKFNELSIEGYSDTFKLCETIDEVGLNVPDQLKDKVLRIRRAVKETILQRLFDDEYKQCSFDVEGSKEATRRLELAKIVSRIISRLEMIKPDEFDQAWIQYNFEDEYKEMSRLLVAEDTKLLDWEEFKGLLPPDLQRRFVPKYTVEKGFILSAADIKPYEHIARKLGPEAVAELLVASGKVKKSDFEKAVNFISRALGRCKRDPIIPEDLGKKGDNIPGNLLHKKGVFNTVFTRLRNYIYQQLLDGQEDVSSTVAGINLEREKRRIKTILDDILVDEDFEEHAKLLKKLVEYFEKVLSIEVPPNMVDKLPNGDDSFEFPSLRQRIAMKEMKKKKRQLISFFMGKGKTAAAFLSKEHVGAKRMLYVCPPGELEDEIEARVKKYYKPGQEPSVGIIRSLKPDKEQRRKIRVNIRRRKAMQGLSKEDYNKEFNRQFKEEIAKLRKEAFEEAISKDIVILPYSMFSSKIDGQKITDLVCEQEFDFMTVDEVHHARKDDTKRNTRVIYKLATGIKDLYEKGHIALLSADPMPNSPDDIVAQLRIWNKDLYKDVTTLRAAAKKHLHPLFIRNEISEFFLLIDEEEDWQKHEVPVEFELNDEERVIYNSILWDEDIPPTVKMQLLYLCVLNPGLFSSSSNVESSLFNECVNLTNKSFEDGHNSVVIVENRLKQGITRGHLKRGGDSIQDKLRKEFGDDVEIEFLDGDVTNKNERKRITGLMKTKSKQKRIFLVNGNIIREGINLSAISRCIMLDPTFNKADTVQLLKRFAREGNEEAKLYSLCVMGTIMEAIRQHADAKYLRTQIVKYGGTLTDDDYALLEEDIFDCKLKIDDEYVLISSFIKDHTLTERQKMAIVMSQLFTDRKVENVEELLDKFGQYIAERYMIDWESSPSGNNSRMVCGLVKDLEDAGIIEGGKFLDVASGPLVLRNTLGEIDDSKNRTIHSLDINSHMLDIGKTILKKKDKKAKPRVKVGKMNDLSPYADESFDVLNNSLAFDYTKLSKRITKNFKSDQRVQTLTEFNRVLKPGGVAIITLPPNILPSTNFFDALKAHFGFEVVEEFTGQGVSTDKKDVDTFKNNTIVLKKVGKPNIEGVKLEDLQLFRVAGTGGARIRDKQEEKPKEMPLRCAHNEFAIKKYGFQYPSEKSEKVITEFPRTPEEKADDEAFETDKRDRNDKIRSEIRLVQDKFKGDFPLLEQRRLEEELDIQFSYADSKRPTWFRHADIKCKPDEVQWFSIE